MENLTEEEKKAIISVFSNLIEQYLFPPKRERLPYVGPYPAGLDPVDRESKQKQYFIENNTIDLFKIFLMIDRKLLDKDGNVISTIEQRMDLAASTAEYFYNKIHIPE